jgi:hypothetical protein
MNDPIPPEVQAEIDKHRRREIVTVPTRDVAKFMRSK